MAVFFSKLRDSMADGPPRGYSAVFWFLEMIAFSLVLAAIDQMVAGHYGFGSIVMAIALVLSAAGLAWPSLQRRREASKLAESNRPKKIGFSEALIAREASIEICSKAAPILAAIINKGVVRQEEIKQRQASLNANQRGARERFNQGWVDHARNVRQTAKNLRAEIPAMKAAARTWKECEGRIMDWQRSKQDARPPDRWISGYQTFVDFREQVRKGADVFERAENNWSQDIREMHRDLDAAVAEHGLVSKDIAVFFRELEAMCTLMIDAVDEWKRKTWASRMLASAMLKISGRKNRLPES